MFIETCQGQKILILHGWGASSKSWDKVKELLEKEGFSVFVPDLPGFGQEPQPSQPWGVDDYVTWTETYIKEKSLSGFVLVGHSFGGRVSLKLSAKRPELVERLVLVSAAGITFRPKTRLLLLEIISKIGTAVFSLPVLNVFKRLVKKTFYRLIGNYDYYLLDNKVMQETFRRTINENLLGILPMVKTRTFILWGEKDLVTPLPDAREIEKQIPGAVLKILPGVGHFLNSRHPEILSRELTGIIRKL